MTFATPAHHIYIWKIPIMITAYQTPQQYLDATQGFLEECELENNLILGLCNGFTDKAAVPKNCVFINAFDGDTLRATSIKTLTKAIVAGNTTDGKHIKALADYYLQNNTPLQGVFGEPFYAEQFAGFYGKEYFTQMTLLVHQLTQVKDIHIAPGKFQIATEADTELITDWSMQFEADAQTTILKTRADLFKNTQTKIAQGCLFKWVHNNQMQSIAAIVRKTTNVGVLGMVYTPANLRGKGYATSTVAKLSQHILQSGFKYCGLFTDKANPTSNSIYKKIGYKAVTEFADIAFR